MGLGKGLKAVVLGAGLAAVGEGCFTTFPEYGDWDGAVDAATQAVNDAATGVLPGDDAWLSARTDAGVPRPGDAALNPDDATARPGDATVGPDDATVNPVDGGPDPDDAAVRPDDAASRPVDARSNPVDGGPDPDDAAVRPDDAASNPVDGEPNPIDAAPNPPDAEADAGNSISQGDVGPADAVSNPADSGAVVDAEAFDLGVPIEPEVDCRDGVDNNGDGLVDCADPTCFLQIGGDLTVSPLVNVYFEDGVQRPTGENGEVFLFTCLDMADRVTFVVNSGVAGTIRIGVRVGVMGVWDWTDRGSGVPAILPNDGVAHEVTGNYSAPPEVDDVLVTWPYSRVNPDTRP